MEMSLDYMRETAEALEKKGYALSTEEEDYGDDVRGYRFHFEKPGQTFSLETVVHPARGETYYLEISDYHGLRSHSFELDSWKHRADRIEFKYQPRADGTGGLAFIIGLPDG